MHNIILLLVESPCELFRCIINLHSQHLLVDNVMPKEIRSVKLSTSKWHVTSKWVP
jgi:hypothetical protein